MDDQRATTQRTVDEKAHHQGAEAPASGIDACVESWRIVWREGVAPLLSDAAIEALWAGLVSDDPRLIQGATTTPPPLQCVQDWPVEAACALGYAGWQGDGLKTVAEVEEFFARTCFEIDQRMGEPAACRHWLNWFDDVPRDEMRRELLVEVQRTLAEREYGPTIIVEARC